MIQDAVNFDRQVSRLKHRKTNAWSSDILEQYDVD